MQPAGAGGDDAQQDRPDGTGEGSGDGGEDQRNGCAPPDAGDHELWFSYIAVQSLSQSSRFSATSASLIVIGSSASSAYCVHSSGSSTALLTGYMNISSGRVSWNSWLSRKSMKARAPSGFDPSACTPAYSTCWVHVPRMDDVRPSSAAGDDE